MIGWYAFLALARGKGVTVRVRDSSVRDGDPGRPQRAVERHRRRRARAGAILIIATGIPERPGRVTYAAQVQIHALMLADSAQAVDGKLYILGGAWNVLRFPEFPAQLLVGIAVAIDVDWNETNRRHHLEVQFEDADGNRMDPRIGADFEAGRPPGAVAGADLRIVFAVNGPLVIPAPGSYSAVASVGGEVLARARFQAVQQARSN